jgi:hypothetical protein
MRRAARREYEEKYTAETNYRMLMRIYEEAAEGSRFSGSGKKIRVRGSGFRK